LADDRLIARFAAAMAASGPMEDAARLAVAVSGGADSMALALLADDWARARGGGVLALVVDHGLRPASAAEAELTVSRLGSLGLEARLLTISGLTKGPGVAMRAREARYRILTEACAARGILHLLLGHHAADQAETTMIRVLGGSGGRGLSSMASVAEARTLRALRPLLTVPPAWLRAFLMRRGVRWVEDPSNRDPTAQRARIRRLRDDPGGEGAGTRMLIDAARQAGLARAAEDSAIAATLARRVSLRPEGYALLTPGPMAPEVLAALVRTIAGGAFTPSADRLADLAANPGPRTVAGVRILAAGRLGEGWLWVREARAAAPPVPAPDGTVWDGRFHLRLARPLPAGTLLRLAYLGQVEEALAQGGEGERVPCPRATHHAVRNIHTRNKVVVSAKMSTRDGGFAREGRHVPVRMDRPMARRATVMSASLLA
jgi:tRNA(Ile)-lysidine synthase